MTKFICWPYNAAMRLADWLSKARITRKAFAARVGVSPSHITLLCTDAVWPGRDVAARIVRATGGEVTADSFLPPPRRPRAAKEAAAS